MSRKNILILVGVLIIVLLAVYFWPKGGPTVPSGNLGPDGGSAPVTREEVPENVAVPEEGAENVAENVAVPETVVAAGPATDLKLRVFDLAYSDGKFTPDTIIVREGDRVTINFAPSANGYDFKIPDYGVNWEIPKGGVTFGFGAYMEGKFKFYCESCGGIDGKAVGYVIVAPK